MNHDKTNYTHPTAPKHFERVEDLRALLSSRSWSPETLAGHTGVSNMTWRRLLARGDDAALPAKYRAVLERFFGGTSSPSMPEPEAMVLSGMGGTRSAVLGQLRDSGQMTAEPEQTVQAARSLAQQAAALPHHLRDLVTELVHRLPGASHVARSLVLGGLVYLVNPFDLVADAIVGLGFIDDLGVLSIISSHLRPRRAEG